MTVAQAVSNITSRLKAVGIETASLDAKLIVGNGADMTRVQILTYPDRMLTENQECKINVMADKRIKRMPMQYILGVCEFMGLNFFVNSDTLIPRGDTEILVEEAIDIINKNDYKSAIDIGTGSGAIAVSVGKYTNINISAVDISDGAIDVAIKNAKNNNVNVNFIKSNLLSNVNNRFDLILSNPPYIETNVIDTLEPDVKDYEPMLALDGGNDGLDFYRKIVDELNKNLNNNGSIIFEIGYNQGQAVSSLLSKYNFKDIYVKQDLAGLDRIVVGYCYSAV